MATQFYATPDLVTFASMYVDTFARPNSTSAARGELEPLPLDVASGTDDPAEQFEASQRQGLVRRALSRLDRADRRILLMTLVDGLEPGEIAHQLGMTAEVVHARKSRARQLSRRHSRLTRGGSPRPRGAPHAVLSRRA